MAGPVNLYIADGAQTLLSEIDNRSRYVCALLEDTWRQCQVARAHLRGRGLSDADISAACVVLHDAETSALHDDGIAGGLLNRLPAESERIVDAVDTPIARTAMRDLAIEYHRRLRCGGGKPWLG